jgi:hypothetical protein
MVKPGAEQDYRNRSAMKRAAAAVLFLACFFILAACGIPEEYYLPQVTQVQRRFNTEANISLNSIESYYYAINYTIYYKIYISNTDIDTVPTETTASDVSQRSGVNSALNSDFNAIRPSTEVTDLTASNDVNYLFINRGYYALELDGADIENVLSVRGGNIRIEFPTFAGDSPVMSLNNGPEIPLCRNSYVRLSSQPQATDGTNTYLHFRNTPELRDNANAVRDKNADTVPGAANAQYTYVSMYIVAVGINPTTFSGIYSKPAHINIFKLPDAN